MPLWNPSPPQGESSAQGLYIIGKPLSPKYGAPQGIAQAVPQVNFLLDLFPDAAVAYSLRQLRTNYLGPAIRVKRLSDNATQDIGFLVNGDLDVASIELFVGASDGDVIIIYDQSGNGIDLDFIFADAPQIIIAGVLQKSNNLPAIDFDGLSDHISSTISLQSPASHLFVFGVWEKTDLAAQNGIFNLQSPSENPTRVSAKAPAPGGEIFWDAGNFTTERLATAATFNDLLQHQYTFTKTDGTNNQVIRRDGTELAAKTQVSSVTGLDKLSLGSYGSNADSAAMLWQELVFYDTDKFSNIASIENNMANYWTALSSWIDDLGNSFVTDDGKNLVFVP